MKAAALVIQRAGAGWRIQADVGSSLFDVVVPTWADVAPVLAGLSHTAVCACGEPTHQGTSLCEGCLDDARADEAWGARPLSVEQELGLMP